MDFIRFAIMRRAITPPSTERSDLGTVTLYSLIYMPNGFLLVLVIIVSRVDVMLGRYLRISIELPIIRMFT